MTDRVQLALRAVNQVRRSRGYGELLPDERRALDQNLTELTHALQRPSYGARSWQPAVPLAHDPYANLGAVTGSLHSWAQGVAVQQPISTAPRYGAPFGGVNPSAGPRRSLKGAYPTRHASANPHGISARAAATPNDLARDIGGQGRSPAPASTASPDAPTAAPAPATPPPGATDLLGARARDAVEAVDFSGFVRGLVMGTFQAIVDATAQQVREYADLVANIARSVDSFSRDNVSDNQTRDYLVKQHPKDLRLVLPEPGEDTLPLVLPRSAAEGASPQWLEQYGLRGEALTAELTEGALLDAARPKLGEERMQTLATMVLMGINRIVVDEGHIRAKMQFHASAVDSKTAEVAQLAAAEAGGISGRQVSSGGGGATMVSTMRANAQADASIRADLMGEVNIQFRTETFPLERFADSPAIQLINRHARWQSEPSESAGTSEARPLPASSQGPSRGEP